MENVKEFFSEWSNDTISLIAYLSYLLFCSPVLLLSHFLCLRIFKSQEKYKSHLLYELYSLDLYDSDKEILHKKLSELSEYKDKDKSFHWDMLIPSAGFWLLIILIILI